MTTSTSTSPSPSTARTTPSRGRAALLLSAGIGVAIVANGIVAAVAVAAGADPAFGPFFPAVFAMFTVVGILIGLAGWLVVRRFVPRPATVLAVLVPVVVLLSMLPDLSLFDPASMPGAGPTAAVALMLMHVVGAAVAVPVFRIIAPVSNRR